MVGAGLSGQLALESLPRTSTTYAGLDTSSFQALTVGPGVAPWAAGRVGLEGSNEAGLTYTGRTLRIDARHAFLIGKRAAISLGFGASAIVGARPEDQSATGVYGGGADVPLLIGVHTANDLFAVWFGPRGGFDLLSGGFQIADSTASATTGNTNPVWDIHARHFYGGLVAGLRVGFRHVHLALELDAAYHRVDGTSQLVPPPPQVSPPSTSASVQQFSLAPAGAFEVTF
jgi:hypothetical protein